jgi:hypothetical protein
LIYLLMRRSDVYQLFIIFSNFLNKNMAAKHLPCKLIVVVNMKNSKHSFKECALLTMFCAC